MLTLPIPARPAGRLSLILLALALGLPAPLLADAPSAGPAGSPVADPEDSRRPPRPPGLVILQEKQSFEGAQVIGVFGAVADPTDPDLRSVRVWEERRDRVLVATDRLRCSRQAPLRITGQGGRVFVRALNPGGPITPANRLDHLIWWAVCHPDQAGRDPAGLAAVARSLGYPGTLPEREEILPGP